MVGFLKFYTYPDACAKGHTNIWKIVLILLVQLYAQITGRIFTSIKIAGVYKNLG